MTGTPLGDKTVEVAKQVATDNADELKREAAAMDSHSLEELDWLETPAKEPTPSPEPIEIPPTPQPTPPPKMDFHMSPEERRMRKAKGILLALVIILMVLVQLKWMRVSL